MAGRKGRKLSQEVGRRQVLALMGKAVKHARKAATYRVKVDQEERAAFEARHKASAVETKYGI